MVSNLDFAETFLMPPAWLCPVRCKAAVWFPSSRGHTPSDWRKGFYYHYYEHPGPHNVARQYGIVTERYKLVYFYEPDMKYWELFDLAQDPMELKSVYGQPEYAAVQKDLHQQLDALRAQLKVPAEDPLESQIHVGKPGGKAKLGRNYNQRPSRSLGPAASFRQMESCNGLFVTEMNHAYCANHPARLCPRRSDDDGRNGAGGDRHRHATADCGRGRESPTEHPPALL